MVFTDVFERFVAESPISVMARAILENVCAPGKLDSLFERVADRQYTRELLFSTVVDLMCSVVCRINPSLRQAYLNQQTKVAVSTKAMYEKVNRLELGVSRELVRQPPCAAVRRRGSCMSDNAT